jgi:hypothetical protein
MGAKLRARNIQATTPKMFDVGGSLEPACPQAGMCVELPMAGVRAPRLQYEAASPRDMLHKLTRITTGLGEE